MRAVRTSGWRSGAGGIQGRGAGNCAAVANSIFLWDEQHYLPSAAAYHKRAADKGAMGVQVVKWRHALDEKWATLHFGEVKVETKGDQHVFDVQVYLNDLDPNAVRVELYADGVNDGTPAPQEMKRVRQLAGASDTAPRRCCDPAGKRTNPVAEMIRSTGEKTMKKATAIICAFLDSFTPPLVPAWSRRLASRDELLPTRSNK